MSIAETGATTGLSTVGFSLNGASTATGAELCGNSTTVGCGESRAETGATTGLSTAGLSLTGASTATGAELCGN